MAKRAILDYRTAGALAPVLALPLGERWFGKLLLLGASIGMLTLAFAPISQFYLAWVGLVPWLCVVRKARSQKGAFFWSWLGGTGFFVANMWWMAYVSVPGMIALMAYLGIYWAVAAVLVRGAGLLDFERPVLGGERLWLRILLIAAIWTGLEYVRGTLFTGLPWLYLGHTQTPFLRMCQIADVFGVYGVTFWVACVNALIAFWFFNRLGFKRLRVAGGMVGGMVAVVFAYGCFRWSELPSCTSAGPVVMVVQPNYPQDNKSGEKSGAEEERIEFHLKTTDAALRATADRVDLVVWSETIMPPLNAQARQKILGLEQVYEAISNLAQRHHAAILTGALYEGDWKPQVEKGQSYLLPHDRRNSAYLFEPSGELSSHRYDKHHLVPFGEFIPFKDSLPWLYKIFLAMSPYDFDYTLNYGPEDALTAFTVEPRGASQAAATQTNPGSKLPGLTAWKSTRPARFVVPICFEDIDSRLVARMFRPVDGGPKRADFILNLTNDGWFKANEPPQHLQAAVFRCIENRAPMARSVNTGISGFIDSWGRVTGTIAQDHEGTLDQQIWLDDRLTWYTRFGDFFAIACVIVTAALAGVMVLLRKPKNAPRPV